MKNMKTVHHHNRLSNLCSVSARVARVRHTADKNTGRLQHHKKAKRQAKKRKRSINNKTKTPNTKFLTNKQPKNHSNKNNLKKYYYL